MDGKTCALSLALHKIFYLFSKNVCHSIFFFHVVDHIFLNLLCFQGYFLLFESMLDTVIFARDKWLAPGGVGKFWGKNTYMYIHLLCLFVHARVCLRAICCRFELSYILSQLSLVQIMPSHFLFRNFFLFGWKTSSAPWQVCHVPCCRLRQRKLLCSRWLLG